MYLVSLFSNRTVCYTLILIHLYSDGDKSVWLETSVSVSLVVTNYWCCINPDYGTLKAISVAVDGIFASKTHHTPDAKAQRFWKRQERDTQQYGSQQPGFLQPFFAAFLSLSFLDATILHMIYNPLLDTKLLFYLTQQHQMCVGRCIPEEMNWKIRKKKELSDGEEWKNTFEHHRTSINMHDTPY